MPTNSAGIILAGGRSRRMGFDKVLLEIEGETLLGRCVRAVSSVVTEVLIVGRTELPPGLEGTPAIPDAFPGTGPLGGIATGLEYLGAEETLVVACDLPFLQIELLRVLLELAPGYDAVVPRPAVRELQEALPEQPVAPGRAQPTCAVYARTCMPVMQRRLAAGQFRLRDVLGSLHVRWVEDQELRRVDPEYRSFLNLNTPTEWAELRRRSLRQMGSS